MATSTTKKTHSDRFYFDGKYHNPGDKDYKKVKKKMEYEKEVLEIFGCLPVTKKSQKVKLK